MPIPTRSPSTRNIFALGSPRFYVCAGLWRVRLLTCCSSCKWNSPAYLSLYMSQGVLSRDPFSLLSAGLLNRGRTNFVPTLRLEQLNSTNSTRSITEISAPQPREKSGFERYRGVEARPARGNRGSGTSWIIFEGPPHERRLQRFLLFLVELQVAIRDGGDDGANGYGLVSEDIVLEVGKVLVVDGVEEELLGPEDAQQSS